jgi:hypothetical protein
VITILGERSINIYLGEIYDDAGATATDNVDGDITDKIVVSGDVNPNLAGIYTLTYSVSDKAGNTASSTTSNVYGVYDMSGGAYDVVAAYYDNGHDNLRQNGLSIYNAHPKYKDVYTMGSSDTQANNYTKAINKKGDAVYETSSTATGSTSWYSDRSNTPYTSAPWFIRSGIYSNTSGAGIFYFSYTAGAPNDGVGFLSVLLVGEGL